MASAFAHTFAAVSLGAAMIPRRRLPRVLVVGVLCAVLPDADIAGLALGVSYGDFLGHRGFTHSLFFAVLLAAALTRFCFHGQAWNGIRGRIAVYLFAAIASHGLFDAMTNGGLGVAFLSPFDTTRYFLPFRPLEVSPIGVSAFFTSRSLSLLAGELLWIGLPCLVVSGAVHRWGRGAAR